MGNFGYFRNRRPGDFQTALFKRYCETDAFLTPGCIKYRFTRARAVWWPHENLFFSRVRARAYSTGAMDQCLDLDLALRARAVSMPALCVRAVSVRFMMSCVLFVFLHF